MNEEKFKKLKLQAQNDLNILGVDNSWKNEFIDSCETVEQLNIAIQKIKEKSIPILQNGLIELIPANHQTALKEKEAILLMKDFKKLFRKYDKTYRKMNGLPLRISRVTVNKKKHSVKDFDDQTKKSLKALSIPMGGQKRC